MRSEIKPVGEVEIVVEYSDGRRSEAVVTNAVMRRGREALAKVLANSVGTTFDLYVQQMLFGDGGATAGVPKNVNTERNALFGTTRAAKSVIATIDQNAPSQVVFTSVLTFDEANGYPINEMALKMKNGDLYSMATFAGLTKSSSIQVTFNWRISFV
jgi:hypothetical protein